MELFIGGGGFLVAVLSLAVGVLAYRHQRGTEPWKLTKVGESLWSLERVGRREVFITHLLNFHGTEVKVMNDAGAAFGRFRRGSSVILRMDPSIPGTSLTVWYRRVSWSERKTAYAPEYDDPTVIGKHLSWSAPIY